MKELNTLLFALLRSILFGEELDRSLVTSLDGEKLEKLYRISKKHDMAHLVGAALDKNKLLDENLISKKFADEIHTAVFRAENLIYETERIKKAFSDSMIDHIPLKGALIRDIYPESWMRTSCDIDVLVRESDLERAIQVLKKDLGYSCSDKKNFHDIDLFSESGVHLELHFNVKETIPQLDRVLDKVWEYAAPSEKDTYLYCLIPEFFIYHIVAHASYHFVGGGCGIRPFLDLFLLLKGDFDSETVKKLCKQSEIDEFFNAAKLLSDVWFGQCKHTNLTRKMEEYVLSGGVYGTKEAHIAARQEARGGKIGYVGSRIFVSYDHLKQRYPTLKSHAMTPVYQVYRWVDLLRHKSLSRSLNELKITKNLDKEKVCSINSLMHDLNLSGHIK